MVEYLEKIMVNVVAMMMMMLSHAVVVMMMITVIMVINRRERCIGEHGIYIGLRHATEHLERA